MADIAHDVTSDIGHGVDPMSGEPRHLPHNVEAEQALLGALMIDQRLFERIGELIAADHFYNPIHQRIFSVITDLIGQNRIADPITLKDYLGHDAALAGVGGAAYLDDLASGVVTILNAEHYARAIRDLHLRRQLISIGSDMVNSAFEPSVEEGAEAQIEAAEQELFQLASTGEVDRGAVDLKTALNEAMKQAAEAFERDSHVTGVTTGLMDVDRKLGGLHKSDLLILAGRPSMGKTALATNIAFNAARAFLESDGVDGAGVAFFSLEMSAEQLAGRILAEITGIRSDKIRRGEIKETDFRLFVEASQQFMEAKFFIDDTPGLSIGAMRTRARRLKRQHGIGLVVVDYLQLLHAPGANASDGRVLEIGRITRGLKALAKELDLPVLALSQLSRQVENREDKRPQLADLRESGTIEQDADVVMFVYREQYYHERAVPKPREGEDEGSPKYIERYERWHQRLAQISNTAEVIVAKQRHGPIGTVRLYFEPELTRFSDLADTPELNAHDE